MAVDMGFAGAQEVEVGAVEEEDGFAHFVSCMCICVYMYVLRSSGYVRGEVIVVWRMVANSTEYGI